MGFGRSAVPLVALAILAGHSFAAPGIFVTGSLAVAGSDGMRPGEEFVNSTTQFALPVPDSTIAAKVMYRIEGVEPEEIREYEKPFRFEGRPDGMYYLRYWSVDSEGVPSKANEVEVNLDNTSPEVTVSIDGHDLVSFSSKITVMAVDTGTGVSKLKWSIDGGEFADYTAPISVRQALKAELGRTAEPTTHTVTIVAEDHLGQATEKPVEFTVSPLPASLGAARKNRPLVHLWWISAPVDSAAVLSGLRERFDSELELVFVRNEAQWFEGDADILVAVGRPSFSKNGSRQLGDEFSMGTGIVLLSFDPGISVSTTVGHLASWISRHLE